MSAPSAPALHARIGRRRPCPPGLRDAGGGARPHGGGPTGADAAAATARRAPELAQDRGQGVPTPGEGPLPGADGCRADGVDGADGGCTPVAADAAATGGRRAPDLAQARGPGALGFGDGPPPEVRGSQASDGGRRTDRRAGAAQRRTDGAGMPMPAQPQHAGRRLAAGAAALIRGAYRRARQCASRSLAPANRRAAAAALLALLLAALWPHLAWMARRLTDGSDEPWGVLALATVLALAARDARRLAVPRPRRLAASAALALAAGAGLGWLPPLVCAALAMLALAAFVTGALPRRPAAPLVTLLLLALPLIASLQFYLGYPLRAATAQAAAPLLALAGLDVQPAGAALVFDGRTVLIDAPCAGIGMLWVGSYAAALLSYLGGAGTRRTLVNGLAAAALVFAANVLRNAALFFPEAGLLPAPAWVHDAVGLAAFALALLPLAWLTQARGAAPAVVGPANRAEPRHGSAGWPNRAEPLPAVPGSSNRAALPAAAGGARAFAPYVGACLAAAVLPLALVPLLRDGHGGDAAAGARAAASEAVAWPAAFRGQPLTQLALTPLEARFARRFPGAIARFAAGRELLVLRQVTQPTRQLHPAADCFRAAGYAIDPPRAARDGDGRAWSCFVATRGTDGASAAGGGEGGIRLRVCERIAAEDDADGGRSYTDTSAWYWAALRAPATRWWATTVITPLAADDHG